MLPERPRSKKQKEKRLVKSKYLLRERERLQKRERREGRREKRERRERREGEREANRKGEIVRSQRNSFDLLSEIEASGQILYFFFHSILPALFIVLLR